MVRQQPWLLRVDSPAEAFGRREHTQLGKLLDTRLINLGEDFQASCPAVTAVAERAPGQVDRYRARMADALCRIRGAVGPGLCPDSPARQAAACFRAFSGLELMTTAL